MVRIHRHLRKHDAGLDMFSKIQSAMIHGKPEDHIAAAEQKEKLQLGKILPLGRQRR